MLYRERIAVCSEIHTKHTSTQRARKTGFLGAFVKLRKVTTRFVLSDRQSVHMELPCMSAQRGNAFNI